MSGTISCDRVTERWEHYRMVEKQLGGWPYAYIMVTSLIYVVEVAAKVVTVLARYYAPFVYKPSLPFCTNSLWRYIYLQFKSPLTMEELCDSDE